MANLRKRLIGVTITGILIGMAFAAWNWQLQSAQAAPLHSLQAQEETAYEFYTVQPGDTLAAIALQYGVPIELLMQVNNIGDANFIYIGQQLRIPVNVSPTETPTEAATPTETATPLPSATVTPTRTSTPDPKATKASTATATSTSTATPTPAPAAAGDDLWTAPEQQIELFSPVNGAIYHSPIEVIGYSQTFEASVVIRLRDANGNILGTRNSYGGSVDGFAFFQSYIRFEISDATAATVEVFEVSAKDGTEINLVQIPIILRPGQRVIDVDSPKVGETVCGPVRVEGYANTFEANVNVEVLQRNGAIVIASGNATGGSLGNFAEFGTSLNLPPSDAQPALVAIYETDAQDGGEIDHIRVPVSLLAADRECP